MLYHIFYTNLLPKKFGGYTIGPFVFIRPKYKDNMGLHKHELVHVEQFWRTGGISGLQYMFSKKYRFQYEVEAYKEQLKWNSEDKTDLFASFIVEKYGLDVTKEQAVQALKSNP